MSILLEQIRKAQNRSAALDLDRAVAEARGKTPEELASASDKRERLDFLKESRGDTLETREFFERIIGGNELQDANYLARGVRAARSIARIVIREPNGRRVGFGTGFLIASGVLITNHHVLPGAESAVRSEAQFDYELDVDGHPLDPVTFSLAPQRLFATDAKLDFSVVAVAPRAENGGTPLEDYGCLPLIEMQGKVTEGEWLTIIQHPNGERKQLCARENRLIRVLGDVVWYSTDTLGGSSGSAVFNNDWFVVALHHSGVPETRDGRIQTVDGRDWDEARDGEEKIKWKANEGIRASRIVHSLRESHASHPLLQPIFRATPAAARIVESAPPRFPPTPPQPSTPPATTPMSTRQITVQLEIDSDDTVRVLSSSALESAVFAEKTSRPKKPAPFDVPFDATYKDRNGYVPDLLGSGAKVVNLPTLGTALKKLAVPLLDSASPGDVELKYYNYSVVMHSERRFAIYSAASIRGDQRYLLSRKEYSDDPWKPDSRIPTSAQITDFYYRGNQFDRGHLSRNEDLEFGKTQLAAMKSAIDTCHYTNCVPQHKKFNRGTDFWQGIERHILEQSIAKADFHAQVFTGPILEEDDPVYEELPKIQYPVRFWKVVAALDAAGKLFATAYILDQSGVIAEFGLDEAAREVPFGAFKTFQVKITEVERLTGLTFTSGNKTPLSACDPLNAKVPSTRTRRRTRLLESTAAGETIPEGYVLLTDVEDIVTDA